MFAWFVLTCFKSSFFKVYTVHELFRSICMFFYCIPINNLLFLVSYFSFSSAFSYVQAHFLWCVFNCLLTENFLVSSCGSVPLLAKSLFQPCYNFYNSYNFIFHYISWKYFTLPEPTGMFGLVILYFLLWQFLIEASVISNYFSRVLIKGLYPPTPHALFGVFCFSMLKIITIIHYI